MIKVTKRSGNKEVLDLEKIHRILFFACDNITGVSVSEIEMRSQIQFYDGMDTKTIHSILIKAAAELISEETPNYQYVAARLINYSIRKDVYGSNVPDEFLVHVKKLVKNKHYDEQILEAYTEDELNELGKYIKHKRDEKFTYVAMKQWEGKYLLQHRTTGKLYESPQMAYMMIAACLFMKYKENRLSYVKKFYDAISTFDISLPTPIMSGLRSRTRQFSSCVTISTGDDLESIASTNHAVIRYISRKAGLGVNYGRIRAVGSDIRGGEASHTGVIPFLSALAKCVKSCSQGGVRGGAATVHFPLWHYEFEDLVVLKNNKGTENSRVRQLDYCFQINGFLYQRLIDGGNISLFSPSDVPGLYDAFCSDQKKFQQLYLKYENDPKIRKKVKSAIEVFSELMTERAETGRIYIQNIDHVNTHSPFLEEVAPIEQSNLCQEIALPTVPFIDINSGEDGIISLCTLAALNWGNFDNPEDMEEACDLVVRALDELLDYQDYPVIHAKRSTDLYRPLGIGIINFAYFLAKRGLKYGENLELVDKWTEAWSFYLMKSSIELAKEKGRCEGFENLKYSKGILPIDTYKKSVDELVAPNFSMPWDELREGIREYGIRNATLTALMPAETSAQISNSTNGIEKIRSLVTIKASKDGILKQVAPESHKLKNKYDMLWDQDDNRGYLEVCSVLQKYIDQSISANTSYNPEKYKNKKISMKLLLEELIYAYRLGSKNWYYHNTNDGSGEVDVSKIVEEKKESIVLLPPMEDEDDCDSCKI